MQQADVLSTTFAALADPTRRAILARLAKGDASVKDLSAPFDMSQPAISKHLRVLERAGLIEQGGRRSGDPGISGRHRCGTPPIGSTSTAAIGPRASNVSTSTCARSRRRTPEHGGDDDLITDRPGRNDTTTVYSDGSDLVFERTFERRGSASGRPSWTRIASPAGGDRTARPRPSWRWTSGPAAHGATSAAQPDRDDVTFHGTYLEIEPPTRYRWTFLFDVEGVGEMGGPETFTFEDLDGRTKVTSRRHFGSRSRRSRAPWRSGMVGGAVETWDRLAALLAEG